MHDKKQLGIHLAIRLGIPILYIVNGHFEFPAAGPLEIFAVDSKRSFTIVIKDDQTRLAKDASSYR